jgi:hypothetical protein
MCQYDKARTKDHKAKASHYRNRVGLKPHFTSTEWYLCTKAFTAQKRYWYGPRKQININKIAQAQSATHFINEIDNNQQLSQGLISR